jgi:hypothetical protein
MALRFALLERGLIYVLQRKFLSRQMNGVRYSFTFCLLARAALQWRMPEPTRPLESRPRELGKSLATAFFSL